MDRGGGGMVELGEWGEVAPRVLDDGAAPAVEEALRRRLSPAEARPPWDAAASSLSPSSSSSLALFPEGLVPIVRPPGRLFGGGPVMLIAEGRPRGGPMGIDEEGKEL